MQAESFACSPTPESTLSNRGCLLNALINAHIRGRSVSLFITVTMHMQPSIFAGCKYFHARGRGSVFVRSLDSVRACDRDRKRKTRTLYPSLTYLVDTVQDGNSARLIATNRSWDAASHPVKPLLR